MAQPRPRDHDDNGRPGDLPEPPQLRGLRRLVNLLLLVLIGGMLVVAVAMVVQLGALDGQRQAVPGPIGAQSLPLPEGAEIVSIGRAPGEVMMVTRAPDGGETLRVFDAASGEEISATPIRRE